VAFIIVVRSVTDSAHRIERKGPLETSQMTNIKRPACDTCIHAFITRTIVVHGDAGGRKADKGYTMTSGK